MRTSLYIQKAILFAKIIYKYTKTHTLFKNQDNLCYVLIHKKQDTLHYAIFMNFLKLAFIYIQKA